MSNIKELSTDSGHIVIRYIALDGSRKELDLTAEMEKVASAAVEQHERKFHGHQL